MKNKKMKSMKNLKANPHHVNLNTEIKHALDLKETMLCGNSTCRKAYTTRPIAARCPTATYQCPHCKTTKVLSAF